MSPHKPQQAQATATLAELAAFCRARGAKLFSGFTPEVLHDYLKFHCLHGTLAFVRVAGQVAGVAIAWQTSEAKVRAAASRGGAWHACDWTPTDPQGDCLFIGEVVATDATVLVNVLRGLATRHPHWQALPWLTARHGRLVRYVNGRFQPEPETLTLCAKN